MMQPGVTLQRSRETAQGFQVYSNLTYVAAGIMGTALGAYGPIAGSRTTIVAARTCMIIVGIMVVATGIVSTWYHRAGTCDQCRESTIKHVSRIDVACACTTLTSGFAVLLPLTAIGLARRVRAAPIMLLIVAALLGSGATAIHLHLTRHDTRERDPIDYDAKHGLWHVLGASSFATGFVAAFLSLRPTG